MMIVRSLLWAPLLAAAFSVHAGDVSKSNPALADRIALERVRWEARTWPEANGATKPRFDEGAIETALRRRVESGRRAAAAMDRVWGQPITPVQVQAEIDRMARSTRDAAMLAKLWAALDNDPDRIAESLALPILARRLAEARYIDAAGSEVPFDAWLDSAPELAADSSPVRPAGGYRLPQITGGAPCTPDTWRNLVDGPEDGPPPDGVWSAATVWTGAEVLVWSGLGPSGFAESGRRYDPAIGAWETISGVAAPLGRIGAATAWTGREMIVWTGERSGSWPSTGGRYDPALDVWSGISGVAAPPGRRDPTTVWTGTSMIFWGGWTSNSQGLVFHTNTGGIYTPSTDSWSSTPVTGAPSPRRAHGAVWTGSEMIVWGGFFQMTSLSDGARFRPASGTWAAMTTPSGTWSSNPALWTESVMLNSNAPQRYDPAANAWSPTGAGGLPGGTVVGAAAWTGERAVVWGKAPPDLSIPAGAAYDPATNAWSPISLSGSPSARSGPLYAWTGTELFVFGGFTGSGPTYLQTGALYCAACSSPLTLYRDRDGDGHGDATDTTTACGNATVAGWVVAGDDCHDGDATLWTAPGEVVALRFDSATTLQWNPPTEPGAGTPTGYDLGRSTDPTGGGATTCSGVAGTSTSDAEAPEPGEGFYYLARARGACGVGGWGSGTDGAPRVGPACP